MALSRLVESCGNSIQGSVTGIFTVLIEKEIDDDPIAHEVKSLIDGHLVYSTTIAATGRYPAIDVLKSKSRLQNKVQEKYYVRLLRKLKTWFIAISMWSYSFESVSTRKVMI